MRENKSSWNTDSVIPSSSNRNVEKGTSLYIHRARINRKMKETERSKEISKFPSLGRGAPIHSEKQMFGRNDDGFHFRNIDFEVMAKTSG